MRLAAGSGARCGRADVGRECALRRCPESEVQDVGVTAQLHVATQFTLSPSGAVGPKYRPTEPSQLITRSSPLLLVLGIDWEVCSSDPVCGSYAPSDQKFVVRRYPRPVARPQPSTTSSHRRPSLAGPQPRAARSAEGAMACGMIESNAAAQEGRADGRADTDLDAEDERFGRPVDHRPDDDAHRFAGALTGKALVDQSPSRKTPTPISIQSTVCQRAMCTSATGRRPNATAEIIAPAPNPARMPAIRVGTFVQQTTSPKMGTTSAGPAQTPCRT